MLSYYRSQHDNQSWIAALAAILDSSSRLLAAGDSASVAHELTFAMARHACVDLCLVFWLPPVEPPAPRLTADELKDHFAERRSGSEAADSASLAASAEADQLRELYEPFLQVLATYFCFRLPRFVPDRAVPDNWQTSAWMRRAPSITELPAAAPVDDHF